MSSELIISNIRELISGPAAGKVMGAGLYMSILIMSLIPDSRSRESTSIAASRGPGGICRASS